jgi:hypothetical protein
MVNAGYTALRPPVHVPHRLQQAAIPGLRRQPAHAPHLRTLLQSFGAREVYEAEDGATAGVSPEAADALVIIALGVELLSWPVIVRLGTMNCQLNGWPRT